jgi:hypothetical protein
MREAFRVTPGHDFQYQDDKVDALQGDEAPQPFISSLHSLFLTVNAQPDNQSSNLQSR